MNTFLKMVGTLSIVGVAHILAWLSSADSTIYHYIVIECICCGLIVGQLTILQMVIQHD